MIDESTDLRSLPVLLIGASCRAAAESLNRLGIESEAWDLFADRDTHLYCRAVHEIEAIHEEQLCEVFNRPRSFVLPCGGLENHYDLWSKLAMRHVMLGPSIDQLQKLRDPFWLSAFCNSGDVKVPITLPVETVISDNFIPIAPFSATDSSSTLTPFAPFSRRDTYNSLTPLAPFSGRDKSSTLAPPAPFSGRDTSNTLTPLAPFSGRGVGGEGNSPKGPGKRWLLKQHHSGGGLKVLDLQNLPEGFSFPHDALLQEFIDGREISITMGCTEAGQTRLLAVMGSARELQLSDCNDATPFLYQGSFGPMSLEPDRIDVLRSFFDRLTDHLHFVGVLQADMIMHREGIALLEMNPRWTASMELAEVNQPNSILSQLRSQKRDQLMVINEIVPMRANYTKLICYASREIRVDPLFSDAMFECLEWSTCDRFIHQMQALQIDLGVHWSKLNIDELEARLADVPRSGTKIEAGQPICSLLIKDKPKN